MDAVKMMDYPNSNPSKMIMQQQPSEKEYLIQQQPSHPQHAANIQYIQPEGQILNPPYQQNSSAYYGQNQVSNPVSYGHQQPYQQSGQQGAPAQNDVHYLARDGAAQQKNQDDQINQYLMQLQQMQQIKQADGYQFVQTIPKVIGPNIMDCIIPPSDDLGGLYLGGLDAALSVELLKKHKIRAVLTTSVETPIKYAEEIIHFHECLPAHDKNEYEITTHFDKAFEFIERHRKYTSVLVHCYAGVSRSASLVIAYLIKKFGWSLEKSLWFVRQKRRFVKPNVGFMNQLCQFERQNLGYSSLAKRQAQPQYAAQGNPQQKVYYQPQGQGQPGVPAQGMPAQQQPSQQVVYQYVSAENQQPISQSQFITNTERMSVAPQQNQQQMLLQEKAQPQAQGLQQYVYKQAPGNQSDIEYQYVSNQPANQQPVLQGQQGQMPAQGAGYQRNSGAAYQQQLYEQQQQYVSSQQPQNRPSVYQYNSSAQQKYDQTSAGGNPTKQLANQAYLAQQQM